MNEELTKTKNPSDVQLIEEEMKQVAGGFLKITMQHVIVSNVSLGGHGADVGADE